MSSAAFAVSISCLYTHKLTVALPGVAAVCALLTDRTGVTGLPDASACERRKQPSPSCLAAGRTVSEETRAKAQRTSVSDGRKGPAALARGLAGAAKPRVVLANQDAARGEAVARVLPQSWRALRASGPSAR